MKRIVLSDDCKVIGFAKKSRCQDDSPSGPRIITNFAEVELSLLMPRGVPDEARIPLPKDDDSAFDEVHVNQRYRLVLEPID